MNTKEIPLVVALAQECLGLSDASLRLQSLAHERDGGHLCPNGVMWPTLNRVDRWRGLSETCPNDCGPIDELQVLVARDWLREHPEARSKKYPKTTRYGLKHMVEHWSGEYVSNDTLIRATFDLGYCVGVDSTSPNVTLCSVTKEVQHG